MLSRKTGSKPILADPSMAFAGRYGSGHNATRVAATITMQSDGLLITPANAASVQWAYADLRVAEPIRERSIDAVVTSRNADRASLYLDDTLLLAMLIQRCPQLTLGRERWRTARPGLAVGATALAIFAGIWAFDLSPTKGIARTMPEKARVVLGESVIRTMPAQRRCVGVEGHAALGKLMHRLMPNGPITADNIIVLDWSLLNAFAVPGNRIVLTRGLIEQAKGPDEVAAVIGHETGHSIELHPEASLVRSVGFWALVQMVFTGTPGAIGNIGVVLAQLGYTRSAEREADGHALRLLREAHISPKPMGDFFRRLDKRTPSPKSSDSMPVGDILSSHPSNPERIARIDSQPAYDVTPALADDDWKALKSICGNIEGSTPGRQSVPGPKPMPETVGKQPGSDAAQAAAMAAAKAEAAKVAAAKIEATRLEIARADAAKQEAARIQKARDDAERARLSQEAAKAAAAKAEADRIEAARRETERAETAKTDAADKQTVAAATGVPSAPTVATRPNTAALPVEIRISEASKRIAINAADAAALIERGQAHAANQDTAAAIEDFSRVLALKPADANTLFWRAAMYAQRGQIDDAIADYDGVIKLQPKNFAAYNNRGSLYRSQKKLDLALRDYTAAIAIDAKQAIALTNRALVHRERGQLDAAMADLNAAVSANPSYANAYTRRGETLELRASREAAITDYRAVLRFPEPAGNASEPHKTARARLTALGVKF